MSPASTIVPVGKIWEPKTRLNSSKFSRELSDIIKTRLHRKAARLWKKRNLFHEAIRHYLEAGDHEEAASLLTSNGIGMEDKGHINQVLFYCQQLPENVLERRPRLKIVMGRALFHTGRTRAALDVFKSSRRQFGNNGDRDGFGLNLLYMGFAHFICDEFAEAEEVFSSVLSFAPYASRDHYMALAGLILILGRMGRIEEADQYFQQAAAIIEKEGESASAAHIYSYYCQRFLESEDFGQAIYYGEKARSIAVRFGENHIIGHSCLKMSHAWRELGEIDKSYETALEGIRILEDNGLLATSYGECLLTAGLAAAHLGNVSEGLDYCRRGTLICEQTDNGITRALGHLYTALILLMSGNLQGAEASGFKALHVIEHSPISTERVLIKISLAFILSGSGRAGDAYALVKSIDGIPSHKQRLIRVVNLIHAGWYWEIGRKKSAKTRFTKVLEARPAAGKDILLIRCLRMPWMPPLLAEIYADGKYPV